jgi:hypothetical protein
MKHLPFEEEQRFTQLPWLWVAAGIPVLAALFMISVSDMTQNEVIKILLSLVFGYLPVFAILYFVKYEIRVNREGLQYKFLPVVWRWETIPAVHIKTIHHQSGSFIDRLLIGYRHNRFTKTKRMNISGNGFVLLSLTDGKKLKIGSTRSEELYAALKEITSSED